MIDLFCGFFVCVRLDVSERNLSNVEEIGTCSYIIHIITMTTLYIQQVCLLPFPLLVSFWLLSTLQNMVPD